MFGYLKLRAINPARNVNRVYEIQIGQGLLNTITVLIAYGRLGGSTQQRFYHFDTLFEAHAFVQKSMQKRLNAHKRIGCGYEVVQTNI
jgi:predicted DNA-binding WGR domain protein